MQSRRTKVILASVVAVFVFGVVMALNRGERSRDLVLSIEPINPSSDITVHVGGAVEEPGLYSLPRGSRVADALDLAILLENADPSGLQLARVLEDEQSIIVAEEPVDPVSSDRPSETSSDESTSSLVDLNTASESELEQLPGIGPALASRIIERRNLEGPFQSVDELSEVSGISDRMVDDLRGLVSVNR